MHAGDCNSWAARTSATSGVLSPAVSGFWTVLCPRSTWLERHRDTLASEERVREEALRLAFHGDEKAIVVLGIVMEVAVEAKVKRLALFHLFPAAVAPPPPLAQLRDDHVQRWSHRAARRAAKRGALHLLPPACENSGPATGIDPRVPKNVTFISDAPCAETSADPGAET